MQLLPEGQVAEIKHALQDRRADSHQHARVHTQRTYTNGNVQIAKFTEQRPAEIRAQAVRFQYCVARARSEPRHRTYTHTHARATEPHQHH